MAKPEGALSRRVGVLSSHLLSYAPAASPSLLSEWLIRDNRSVCARGSECPTRRLTLLSPRTFRELRDKIFAFFGRHPDVYGPRYDLSLEAFRELTMRRVQLFVQQGFFKTIDYAREPLKFQAALESMAFCDYSMAIKSGVHFTLCGGYRTRSLALCAPRRSAHSVTSTRFARQEGPSSSWGRPSTMRPIWTRWTRWSCRVVSG